MRQIPLTDALLRERNTEVARYLEFLQVAIERRAKITAKDGELTLDLSLELTHTLKANLVLLLYSAMEATLVQLLDEIHEVIGSNCTDTDMLNKNLMYVILETVKKANKDSLSLFTAPLHQSLFSHWISDWQGKSQAKEKRENGISGSVDGRIFYTQLKKFGVVPPTTDDKPPSHLTSPSLKIVKDKRNMLAHGEQSFTDLGRELSVTRLVEDTTAVFKTLENISTEVNTYLQEQRYLAQPPAA